ARPPPASPTWSPEGDEARVVEALGVDALDQLGRSGRVDRERHERLAAAPRARDRHVGDVDAGLAEERADPADHAGHVVVAEEDHQRRELHLELEAERVDEPMAVLIPDDRAGGAYLVDLDADEIGEVAARAA